jgi:hypothetical protein
MRRLLFLCLLSPAVVACAAQRMEAPAMAPLMAELARPAPQPAPLAVDVFKRDQAAISEGDLRTVLEAPVFLEAGSRVGIVGVSGGYEATSEAPLADAPGALTEALEQSGLFESATEVATDWPTDRGLSGLRELAARYRTDYLVLFRQRFHEDDSANGWSALNATIVGAFLAPNHTVRVDGMVEATLFDVKTGTLLFTVFERVSAERKTNTFSSERRMQELEQELTAQAGKKLADEVVSKARRLDALRPGSPRNAPQQATLALPQG